MALGKSSSSSLSVTGSWVDLGKSSSSSLSVTGSCVELAVDGSRLIGRGVAVISVSVVKNSKIEPGQSREET